MKFSSKLGFLRQWPSSTAGWNLTIPIVHKCVTISNDHLRRQITFSKNYPSEKLGVRGHSRIPLKPLRMIIQKRKKFL